MQNNWYLNLISCNQYSKIKVKVNNNKKTHNGLCLLRVLEFYKYSKYLMTSSQTVTKMNNETLRWVFVWKIVLKYSKMNLFWITIV